MTLERSPHWQTFRNRYLVGKSCACCGMSKSVEAHHIVPLTLAPELELDERNLIPLCSCNHGCDCHLLVGHLGSFLSFNPFVVEDARLWLLRIRQRITIKNQQDSAIDLIAGMTIMLADGQCWEATHSTRS